MIRWRPLLQAARCGKLNGSMTKVGHNTHSMFALSLDVASFDNIEGVSRSTSSLSKIARVRYPAMSILHPKQVSLLKQGLS